MIHKDLFNCVSGNIINIYSKNDKILKNWIGDNCIGIRNINNNNLNTYSPIIENIDMTQLNLNQNNYKQELNNIIQQIKII